MGHLAPNRLADYLSGRVRGRARAKLEGHLAACQRCRTTQLRVSHAVDALRGIAGTSAPMATSLGAARFEATLRWSRSGSVRKIAPARRWAWGVGSFAAAAAAAAALLVLKPWRHAAPEPAAAPSLAAVQAAPAPSAQPLEAVVTLVGGDARLGRGAASAALNPSAHLASGDQIATGAGGRVGLQWGEGSGALLHPASGFTLAQLEPRAQALELRKGRVSVRVGPHQPGEALQVRTPAHTVVVHGTWFNVASDARGTSIEVLEGVVEVSARDGDGSSTRVAAPQRAFFPRGTGTAQGARALSGREAAALRLASEMGLLPWSGLDRVDQTTGLLTVASTPVAALVVDGVAFGSTPLALRRARGRHLVELSRPGFATISRWVQVGAEPGELHLALLKQDTAPITPAAGEEVRALMHSRSRQISACYEHSLKRDPTLAGTVTLQIQVGDAGQVLGTRASTDTVPDPGVAECLRREAAGWSFQTTRKATVEVPFVFQTP